MKIVYCINNTWYSGGMTRVLANKVNYLVCDGHEVTIITTDQGQHRPHYLLDKRVQQIDLAINYLALDQMGFVRRATKTLWYLNKHKKCLKDILLSIKADVVISMFTQDMFILPGIKDGSAKVIEIHTSHYNWSYERNRRGWIGQLQNWLDLRTIRKFDKFVVLTDEDKSYWQDIPHIISIPNANTFQPEQSSSLTSKTVLAVGRYGHQKNFEAIVSIWQQIHSLHPDWILKIIGDGVKNSVLGQLAIDLGIPSGVSFQESTSDIIKEYMDASIYVLSSRHEGLGMVLLEAQACGVPLVAYNCQCGPSEIITEGENGFLVEVGNEKMLADRILRLIDNEVLRKQMGKSAKEHSKRFSEAIIMAKWLKLFVDLVNKKKMGL